MRLWADIGVIAMLHKDYYFLLEIPRYATDEEIRHAYRVLARRWHPDLNPDVPDAEEHLKRLNEAYRVLRDHDSRANYDRMLFATLASRQPGSVPTTIQRVVRDRRHKSATPIVASVVAAMTLVFFGLAWRDAGTIPYEWERPGYQSVASPADHMSLTAVEHEAVCRQAAEYWQREIEIMPSGALARYNLASAYSELAGIAQQRGDTDVAKHYSDSARDLVQDYASAGPEREQIAKS
jgi:curved DNA-binding protein CbpA